MPTATIIGSGPNSLSAAIVLAAAHVSTTVFERNVQIGAHVPLQRPHCRISARISDPPSTLLGVATPFFRSLPMKFPWIEPTAPCAHPLDDGTAVMLEHSIEATVATLDGCDRRRYRSLIEPLASEFAKLSEDILGPFRQVPRHRFLLARFGLPALLPASALARHYFTGKRAQAFFAGMATHSVLSLEAPASAAVGLTLLAAGTRVVGLFCVVALKLSLMPSPVIWKILAVGLKPVMKLHSSQKLTSFSLI